MMAEVLSGGVGLRPPVGAPITAATGAVLTAGRAEGRVDDVRSAGRMAVGQFPGLIGVIAVLPAGQRIDVPESVGPTGD